MNVFKQLFRQPVRLCAVLLLLGMTASFFSLGTGVLASARATANEVDHSFVTIGIPTTETQPVSVELDNGMTIEYEESIIPFEAWDYLEQMAQEGTLIKEVSRLKAVSAYSPSVAAVTSAGEPGKYFSLLDAPYNTAIFVISVTSVGEWEENTFFPNGQGGVTVEADVEETVMLHPDYAPRTHMTCNINLASRAEYDALDIRPGKRYLVYGEYRDDDLQLRSELAWRCRCSLEEIRYENIVYDIPEAVQEEMKSHSDEDNYEPPVAEYRGPGGGSMLLQRDLDCIDHCYMTVTDHIGRDSGYAFSASGEWVERFLGDFLCDAYMTPLNTELESFLNSDEGIEWRQIIRQLEVQYHCTTVLGTNLLEGIYSFHEQDAFIAQGRSFTQKEYDEGSNSCIISETTALASGLEVGDEIELSFYRGDSYGASYIDQEGSLMTESYSEKVGMSGEGKPYEIVGIYRQSQIWDHSDYGFKPNTIFVPGRSLAEPCHSGSSGVFVSLIIPNGKVEEVKAAFAQQGYPEDIFLFYDNGYAEIGDTVSGFLISSAQLFGVSALVCVTALAVYLAVFVYRQRRTAGLMLSLGSGRSYTRRSIFALAILPVGISTVIGALVGLLFMDAVQQQVFSAASELLSTSFSSGSVSGHAALENVMVSFPYMAILAALAQLILYAAAIFACVCSTVRKPPLELIRKR